MEKTFVCKPRAARCAHEQHIALAENNLWALTLKKGISFRCVSLARLHDTHAQDTNKNTYYGKLLSAILILRHVRKPFLKILS